MGVGRGGVGSKWRGGLLRGEVMVVTVALVRASVNRIASHLPCVSHHLGWKSRVERRRQDLLYAQVCTNKHALCTHTHTRQAATLTTAPPEERLHNRPRASHAINAEQGIAGFALLTRAICAFDSQPLVWSCLSVDLKEGGFRKGLSRSFHVVKSSDGRRVVAGVWE